MSFYLLGGNLLRFIQKQRVRALPERVSLSGICTSSQHVITQASISLLTLNSVTEQLYDINWEKKKEKKRAENIQLHKGRKAVLCHMAIQITFPKVANYKLATVYMKCTHTSDCCENIYLTSFLSISTFLRWLFTIKWNKNKDWIGWLYPLYSSCNTADNFREDRFCMGHYAGK